MVNTPGRMLATLIKLAFLHGCFSSFWNCIKGTKLYKASHIKTKHKNNLWKKMGEMDAIKKTEKQILRIDFISTDLLVDPLANKSRWMKLVRRCYLPRGTRCYLIREEENWHLFTYFNYSVKIFTCKGKSKNYFATLSQFGRLLW